MTRTPISFSVPDMSALARSMRDQLTVLGHVPSHVEMLNLLARAGGHRNFQHLKAAAEAAAPVSATPTETVPVQPAVDVSKARRVAGYFDSEGRLKSWPAKTNLQLLALWILWSRVPPGESFGEREISALIDDWHLFGDRALIRREMVDNHLLSRTDGGRDYRRIEQRPPAELQVMLEAIAAGSS